MLRSVERGKLLSALLPRLSSSSFNVCNNTVRHFNYAVYTQHTIDKDTVLDSKWIGQKTIDERVVFDYLIQWWMPLAPFSLHDYWSCIDPVIPTTTIKSFCPRLIANIYTHGLSFVSVEESA